MKASERLRELQRAQLAELGGQLPDGHPFIKLWFALPLIADVVAAAETQNFPENTNVGRALTALRDALDEPPGWGADRRCPETCG